MTNFEFEDLMAEARKKATTQRQLMRLRGVKAMREVRNGNQTNIQDSFS